MSRDILRALMDPARSEVVPWSTGELRDILAHQLATPLLAELDSIAESVYWSRGEVARVLRGCKGETFGDLLLKPCTSGTAVQMLKEYAKASMAVDGGLPRDVARVLYVSAIIRGRQAGVTDVSTLDLASLEREARRCLTYGWLPDAIRELLGGQP